MSTENPTESDIAGNTQSSGGDSSRVERRRAVKVPYRRALLIAALLVVLAISLAAHFIPARSGKGRPATGEPQPALITSGQSRAGDINVYLDDLGTVTPLHTVTVYSQITGQVVSVSYREGQMVHQGDALIDVDPHPYQAMLTQSIGTLNRDQGLLAQARMDLKRYQEAYARNAIAQQQLDDQRQTVTQYEGTVKADQGTVAYNQVQLAYCHIVAPISGRVGLRLVDPGNTVFTGGGTALVVITQLQPITVVFNVAEDDLPQVQAQLRDGRQLTVEAFDRADEHPIEAGAVTSLDNVIDTTTGTVRLRAQFGNDSLALFPNQFVNARLLVRTLRNTTLVPSGAVQHNGTNDFVYLVKPNSTVAVQPVTTLTSNDEDAAVQGLNPGLEVAVSGFDRLENGARVVLAANASSRDSPPGHRGNGGSTGNTVSPPGVGRGP